MSQRICLWIDGTETEPMEESEVRARVVDGGLSNLTLARIDGAKDSGWQAVGTVLANCDSAGCISESVHQPSRAKVLIQSSVLIASLALAIALVWRAVSGPVRWTDGPSRVDAYRSARQFVMDRFPGAHQIAPEGQSIVERDGQTYRVAFRVDGLNAFGGPVRRDVAVEMRHDGASFSFVRMIQ